MILISVVLPAPFGPTRPRMRPGWATRSTPSRATTVRSVAVRVSSRTIPLAGSYTRRTPSTRSTAGSGRVGRGDDEPVADQVVDERLGIGVEPLTVDTREMAGEMLGEVSRAAGLVEVAPDQRADGVQRREGAARGVEDDGAIVGEFPG